MDTSEKDFETAIFGYLASNGFTSRDASNYDRALCLDPGSLFQFLYATQAKTWEKLKLQHGEQARERFLKRLAGQIERRGTLDILRRGIDDLGATSNSPTSSRRPPSTKNTPACTKPTSSA